MLGAGPPHLSQTYITAELAAPARCAGRVGSGAVGKKTRQRQPEDSNSATRRRQDLWDQWQARLTAIAAMTPKDEDRRGLEDGDTSDASETIQWKIAAKTKRPATKTAKRAKKKVRR